MKFKVEYVVHKDPGNHNPGEYVYSVEFPWMPGCLAEARTLEEAHANAREAAAGWIEVQLEHHPDAPLFSVNPWMEPEDGGQRFETTLEFAPAFDSAPVLAPT